MVQSLTCISRPVVLRPGYTGVFLYPRFSYTGPKTAVTALAPVLCMARTGWVRVYWVGTGWVYRVGNTGEYPAAKDVHRKGPHDSGAGPGTSLQGRWSGWS